jgi:hypothetical protein
MNSVSKKVVINSSIFLMISFTTGNALDTFIYNGVTLLEGSLAGPVPLALVAVTVNV